MESDSRKDDSSRMVGGIFLVPPSRNAPRIFFGLVLIALGVISLLDIFGVVQVESAWRFWPLFLIALGMSRLLRPRGCPGHFSGFILLALGVVFLLHELGLMWFRPEILWPAVLLLIGIRLVWGGWARRALQGPSGDPSGRVSSLSVLGGSEHKSTAADYRGGDATAILGSCKIDLRQASIKSGEAVIDAFAVWGSIEIWVPRDWGVSLHGTPILGSFEDKTNQTANTSGQRLVVRGAAIMGSVEIKN